MKSLKLTYRKLTVAALLGSSVLIATQGNAKYFATMTLTREEFVGCHHRSDDPRCKKLIRIGCKTYCRNSSELLDSKSHLARVCNDLCQAPADVRFHKVVKNKESQ